MKEILIVVTSDDGSEEMYRVHSDSDLFTLSENELIEKLRAQLSIDDSDVVTLFDPEYIQTITV